MQTFHLVVLTVATALLILILTYMGILLSYEKKSSTFPPTANICPDNWKFIADICMCQMPTYGNVGSYTPAGSQTHVQLMASTPQMSSKSGGTSTASVIGLYPDSNTWTTNYPGLSSICAKNKWANQYGVSWDGVSNYNKCT